MSEELQEKSYQQLTVVFVRWDYGTCLKSGKLHRSQLQGQQEGKIVEKGTGQKTGGVSVHCKWKMGKM